MKLKKIIIFNNIIISDIKNFLKINFNRKIKLKVK